MKVILFVLSLFILLCMSGILYTAIIKDSPMCMVGIIIASAMFLLSSILVILTYGELCEKY